MNLMTPTYNSRDRATPRNGDFGSFYGKGSRTPASHNPPPQFYRPATNSRRNIHPTSGFSNYFEDNN